MSKRKTRRSVEEPPAQRDASTAPAATAAIAAEAAPAAGAAPDGSLMLQRARLSSQRAAHSFRLAELLRSNKPIDERMEAVASSILEDATRGAPLIDLSTQTEADGTLLMLLVDALAQTNEEASDSADAKRRKESALRHANNDAVWAHLATLLQSYDLQARRDSRNALHIIADSGVPVDERDWPYRLARLLLQRGADVNDADAKGRTPLHQWAQNDYYAGDNVCGLQVLLEYGADPNAQNSQGNGLLHMIAYHDNERPLRHLAESGLLERADLFAFNKKGETPLSLAWLRETEKPEDAGRVTVRQFLHAQEQAWRSNVRPLLLAELAAVGLAPAPAAVVVGFVDGSTGQL